MQPYLGILCLLSSVDSESQYFQYAGNISQNSPVILELITTLGHTRLWAQERIYFNVQSNPYASTLIVAWESKNLNTKAVIILNYQIHVVFWWKF